MRLFSLLFFVACQPAQQPLPVDSPSTSPAASACDVLLVCTAATGGNVGSVRLNYGPSSECDESFISELQCLERCSSTLKDLRQQATDSDWQLPEECDMNLTDEEVFGQWPALCQNSGPRLNEQHNMACAAEVIRNCPPDAFEAMEACEERTTVPAPDATYRPGVYWGQVITSHDPCGLHQPLFPGNEMYYEVWADGDGASQLSLDLGGGATPCTEQGGTFACIGNGSSIIAEFTGIETMQMLVFDDDPVCPWSRLATVEWQSL